MLLTLEEIKSKLDIEKAIHLQEYGFQSYSEGKVATPPVGHMDLGHDIGDVHIKSGWIKGDPLFVVKVAGAFYKNPEQHNLPIIQGIIIAFDSKTGQTRAILQDKGYLTNLRTAIAGLICAKYLAPKKITGIGVLGTGTQARLQLELLKKFTDCRDVWVYGRNKEKVSKYISDMEKAGFKVKQAESTSQMCQYSNLIITTTSARDELIKAEDIQPGTHITAVGADSPGKQELDKNIFPKADIMIVDSKSQCLDHGEIHHAHQAGLINEKDLIELGTLIANPKLGRQTDSQITVADLTGVGVQDIQIAKAILGNDSREENTLDE